MALRRRGRTTVEAPRSAPVQPPVESLNSFKVLEPDDEEQPGFGSLEHCLSSLEIAAEHEGAEGADHGAEGADSEDIIEDVKSDSDQACTAVELRCTALRIASEAAQHERMEAYKALSAANAAMWAARYAQKRTGVPPPLAVTQEYMRCESKVEQLNIEIRTYAEQLCRDPHAADPFGRPPSQV